MHGKWAWSQRWRDKDAPKLQCHPSAFRERTYAFSATLWPQRFQREGRKVSKSIVSELFLGATILQRKIAGLPLNMGGLEEILSPSLSQVGWTKNISTFL